MFKKSMDVFFLYDDNCCDLIWFWWRHYGMNTLILYIYILSFIWWFILGFLLWFYGLYPIFYGDVYVATRSLWTDLWRSRIWAWLMLWCAPVVGGVAGVLVTTDLGRNGDATVSPRGLPRPTPVSGLLYDIWWF